ncbi:MAG: iron-sulfur cluster assembly scaffold protein, partial [Rhizobiales bacterium]|nr:iron-sulfur cluster assembly scaffold protein [Hyphomicrobiales bacterium]
MINKVYSDKIIKYAANIPLQNRLENPNSTVSKRSIFCGSHIEIDVTAKDQVIVEFGQTIKACALGSTVATIVSSNVIGATFDEIKLAHQQMLAMLKQGGKHPTGKFSELMLL